MHSLHTERSLLTHQRLRLPPCLHPTFQSQMLPEDMAQGGIKVSVDTLQGSTLTALATPDAIKVSDGSSLTSDAIVVQKNVLVCTSVINVLSEVPMPFP